MSQPIKITFDPDSESKREQENSVTIEFLNMQI